MATVKVYRYEIIDRKGRAYALPRKFATAEAIAALGGNAFEETAVEVDAELVAHSGVITMEEMAEYLKTWRPPG